MLFLLLSSRYAFSDSPCQLPLEGDLNRDCKMCNGGFGGIGEEIGAGGGGAGGICRSIYTWNVNTNPFYQNYNTFVETNTGCEGGRGGKSFGNSGSDGVVGAALNYHYQ